MRLSGHGEDATRALLGVVNNPDAFVKLHIVCSYYENGQEPFTGFDELVADIRKAGIHVKICDDLDESNYSDFEGTTSVKIHPWSLVRTGGVGKLNNAITDIERTKNTNAMHFGVSPTLVIPPGRNFATDFWQAISGHGFLMVTLYIDTWWRIYSRGKIYFSGDVQASFICSTYNRKFLPKISRFARIWDNEQVSCTPGGNSAITIPEDRMRGFALARYTINTHNKQTWGLWIIGFMLCGYFWLAYPWWNLFAIDPNSTSTVAGSTLATASNFLVRPFLGPVNLVIYLFHVTMMYLSSSYTMSIPFQAHLCLLYPIYFTLYPLVWIYARLYRPRDTWDMVKT